MKGFCKVIGFFAMGAVATYTAPGFAQGSAVTYSCPTYITVVCSPGPEDGGYCHPSDASKKLLVFVNGSVAPNAQQSPRMEEATLNAGELQGHGSLSDTKIDLSQTSITIDTVGSLKTNLNCLYGKDGLIVVAKASGERFPHVSVSSVKPSAWLKEFDNTYYCQGHDCLFYLN